MHTTKFIITCVVLAVGANIAIIGCNRQAPKSSKTDDSVSTQPSGQAVVPPAQAVSDTQQQGMPPWQNSHAETNHKVTVKQKNPYEKAEIEIKIFQVSPPATGYGYDIIIDGHGYIHQYNIPGVPGNN